MRTFICLYECYGSNWGKMKRIGKDTVVYVEDFEGSETNIDGWFIDKKVYLQIVENGEDILVWKNVEADIIFPKESFMVLFRELK